MLSLNAITVRLGGQTILDNASAALPPKSRVGIVGRNGAGKSTLLKVIAGELEADGGSVETPRGTRIGYVAQETPGGSATPFETVLSADEEREELLAAADTETDPHRIADIHERLNLIDAHDAPARAARILAGLGFDEEAQHRPLSSFSGGWRMRVALAGLLFSRPDLLLLDEPSNHLDLEAALWLESFLRTYPASMVIVSHERDLLNNVADHILHVQGGQTTLYTGGYDAFERQRRERLNQVEAMRARQEEKRAKLQAYVDRWRYKAHTARQAQSRMKALERMEPIAAATEDPTLSFDFPDPDELRPPLIVADEAAVGYEADNPVLSNLAFRIDPDDRIALLGRNGNGKTTLARLLAGQLEPMAGKMSASGKLRVGYFAQHQVEELVADDTPLDHMTRLMPDAKPGVVRAQLGRFGFSGDKVHLEVKRLSGGERARLSLALITRDAPHILILDEPTNHLDVDAREALVQALNAFEGAAVVVSHDRHLLEATADRLILIDGGRAREFDGSLDDYRDLLLGRGQPGADEKPRSEGPKPRRGNRKDERRAAAEARERTKHLRVAVRESEKAMTLLGEQRTAIDRAIFDPDNAPEPYEGKAMSDLMKLRGDVEKKLERAEAAWLDASEALERLDR
ncbi:MAG: ABC-F family ATP-binding cassette domain-containing protein, partial [Alphaproteobacteria bacterium]|nr:ABC-F family ATP-binding cassette domain-containing protein [Alphaproteobacteria bacterium]